jgi:hypothetical protein
MKDAEVVAPSSLLSEEVSRPPEDVLRTEVFKDIDRRRGDYWRGQQTSNACSDALSDDDTLLADGWARGSTVCMRTPP